MSTNQSKRGKIWIKIYLTFSRSNFDSKHTIKVDFAEFPYVYHFDMFYFAAITLKLCTFSLLSSNLRIKFGFPQQYQHERRQPQNKYVWKRQIELSHLMFHTCTPHMCCQCTCYGLLHAIPFHLKKVFIGS